MATPAKPTEQPRPYRETGGAAKRPIAVVDFGKPQSRQRIKRLRKGKGKLLSRVESIVDELLESPAIAKTDQPPVIVIVLREQVGSNPLSLSPFG
jgi:hypothetical protein